MKIQVDWLVNASLTGPVIAPASGANPSGFLQIFLSQVSRRDALMDSRGCHGAEAFGRIISDTSFDVSPRNFIIIAAIAVCFWIAFFVQLVRGRKDFLVRVR